MPKAPPTIRKRVPRAPWEGRTAKKRTVTGFKLQKARESLFKREPLCRPCKAQGFVKIATIRDHIIPLAEGGEDTEGNTQPICADCHKHKTHEESKRGAARAKEVL